MDTDEKKKGAAPENVKRRNGAERLWFNATKLNDQFQYNVIKEKLGAGISVADFEPELKDDLKARSNLLSQLDREYPHVFDEFLNVALSKMCAGLIGRYVKFNAQVIGCDAGKAISVHTRLKCAYCDTVSEADVATTPEELYALIITSRYGGSVAICSQCKRKTMKTIATSETDLSVLYIRDLPEQIDAMDEEQYLALASKVWQAYYIGIPINAQRARMGGFVFKNPKTSEIEFVITSVEPLEAESLQVQLTDTDKRAFKEYFQIQNMPAIVAHQIAPHIVHRDLAKESALLTLHSARELMDIYGRRIRGTLHTLWFGDTKTSKSEQGKDITFAGYGLGEFAVGETASRAGILYGIPKDRTALLWGILPLNDSGFVFLDGIHTIPSEQAAEMREALEQERVVVNRIVKAMHLMRLRIIATLNPPTLEGMASYLHKVQGLIGTEFFKNPPDLTRWDLFISFAQGDVNQDDIIEAVPHERPIPLDTFKKHIYWVWTLKPDAFSYTSDAKQAIISQSKELGVYRSAYPIVNDSIRDVITRLSVAYACLTHSTTDGQRVEICKEHVDMAADYYGRMLFAIDYPAFVEGKTHSLEASEIEMIVSECKKEHMEILKLLQFNTLKSPELAAKLGKSDRTIKEYYEPLRKFGLIETSTKFGVKLTIKGVAFLKWLRKAPEVKDKLTSDILEGQKNLPTAPLDCDTPSNAKKSGEFENPPLQSSSAEVKESITTNASNIPEGQKNLTSVKRTIVKCLEAANGGAYLSLVAGNWDYLYKQLPDIDKEIIDRAMLQLRYDGTIYEPKPGVWHLNGVS